MKNYTTLTCCFLFLLINTLLFSQDGGGYLNFTGRVINDESLPMKGVTVKLMKDDIEAVKLTTKKNGQFNFNIFFDDDYKIAFSYPGYTDMYLIIYASMAKGEIIPAYQTEVTLYSDTTRSIDVSKFKDPFLKLVFDGKDNFILDQEYDVKFKRSLVSANDKVTATTATEITAATPTNTSKYSKSNCPEKFLFADADKDNAVSPVEVNAIVNKFKSDNTSYKKDVIEELIAWFFE